MKEIKIQPSLAGEPELREAIQRATPWLERAIGEPANSVKAVWDLKQDEGGRKGLELTLEDWTGSVSSFYAPDELNSERQAYRRFYRQWGDLLQQYTRRQVERLRAEAAQSGKE
jgi:hypothetical protein